MEESTTQRRTLYQGRVVGLELHDVRLPDGRTALREIVRHAPAVAVIAELPDGRFALVRQYRKPVERTVLEVVASIREPGETAVEAARRELLEETGYSAVTLTRLGTCYPSPGYVDEQIDLFHAQLAREPVATSLDEDENVCMECYTSTEISAMIDRGEIQDAKTLLAWFWWQRERSV